MGLGSVLRNLQYDVTDTVTGEQDRFTIITENGGAYPDWSTGEYSGGMALPGMWRAAVMLSDLLGGLPWQAFQAGPGQVAEQVPTPPILLQPAPPDTRMTSFSSMALDLTWHGNAVALIAGRDRIGLPTEAVPVPVDMINVRRVRGGDELGLRPGDVAYDVGGRIFGSTDVVHVKGPCRPGALRGMGVIENHLNGAMRLAAELQRQAGDIGGHAVPTGVLTSSAPDLTEGEANDAKASWMASQRSRTVAVLNSTLTFQPLAWNPTETQLLEARKFSLLEQALIMGVDPSWLGAAQTSRVYSNIEQEAINLTRYSAFGGMLARFEASFSGILPPGQWAEANLDALLRPDTLGRYQAHQIGIGSGFLLRDEARSLERRPPLTAAQRAEAIPPTPAPAPSAPPSERSVRGRGTGGGGGDESDLLIYWTVGAGRARWAEEAEPLRALYDHLVKHMDPDLARATALSWFELALERAPEVGDGQLPGGKP